MEQRSEQLLGQKTVEERKVDLVTENAKLREFVDMYLRTYARTDRNPTHYEEVKCIRMAEELTLDQKLKSN